MLARTVTRKQGRGGWKRVCSCAAVIGTLVALACGESVAPNAYASIRIEPRELHVPVGATHPLAITIRGVRFNGTTDMLSRSDVGLSVADTTYAIFKGDSLSARVFGGTYLLAEYRRGTRRGPRDSIQVFIIRASP